MSEVDDIAEGPATEALPPGGAAAATALALGRATRGNKALDAKAASFLDQQTRLAHLQSEHLHEQRALTLSRLRLGRWKDRVSLALQAMTAAVGLIVAAAVGVMAWQASADHGLSIEPFSVPPELAQRGLTGQVVAARVLDRLSEFQAATVSGRPASSYADNWGDDIKVEIPETGVSIGELNRYLRQWLGHETRITGEVVRMGAGLSVTARAGAEAGRTFTGADADLDRLIGQAAEAVYAGTQPYRYAVYLASHGRPDAALAAYVRLARSGSPEDRRWAYAGWSEILLERGDNRGAETVVREGMARGLSLFETGAMANLNSVENNLGHAQGELDALRLSLKAVKRAGKGNAFISAKDATRLLEGAALEAQGDYRTAVARWSALNAVSAEGGRVGVVPSVLLANAMARNHEVTAALKLLGPPAAQAPTATDLFRGRFPARVRKEAMIQGEDWPRLVSLAEQQRDAATAAGPVGRDYLEREVWPDLALGYAQTGRLAEAQGLISRTPPDCDTCLDVRAQIAALAKDWTAADRWFAALDRQAPEIPDWDADWGRALLAKGDVDGAIAKLGQAHQKGPHFADPLELWGEALMQKGDFTGAARKFAEADKDAPRWGRNHLRWGQALARLGRADEARAQYRAAAGMDLSPMKRAELARLN